MKKALYKQSGFTLVELLVVIAIIAILTGIITSNFTQAKSKARDAKRISDLAQLQLTLELAFDRCNVYPPNINDTDTEINGADCLDDGGNPYILGDFISKIPKPFIVSSYVYGVSSPDRYDYVLKAHLEEPSSVLEDDIDGNVLNVDCDDVGQTGGGISGVINIPFTYYRYCVQPR